MSTPSTLLVTGASGLIGQGLSARRPVTALTRKSTDAGPWWSPLKGEIHAVNDPIDAVVHLAGAPVAGGRWTSKRKADIFSSRQQGTRTVVNWIAAQRRPPSVLVSASAIGLYGNRGDEVLDESAPRGDGFLADVVEAWEEEAQKVVSLGVRLVVLRLGIVLSAKGGALAQMLPPFRMGLGGPLGSGAQWFPWIHIDDALNVVERAIDDDTMSGAYNVVAPGIVRQRDFARALGGALRRPARMPAPRVALRATFGEMADEALLSSARVVPSRLQAADMPFQYPMLKPALQALLRR